MLLPYIECSRPRRGPWMPKYSPPAALGGAVDLVMRAEDRGNSRQLCDDTPVCQNSSVGTGIEQTRSRSWTRRWWVSPRRMWPLTTTSPEIRAECALADVDGAVARSYSAVSRLGTKRAAPNAARGVPVAEAAKYLGVSEPTVWLWVRRGALAALSGSKPALIEHESLRGLGARYANCAREARTESGWRAWFATSKTWRIVRVRAYARA
jgi:hypothetical protein